MKKYSKSDYQYDVLIIGSGIAGLSLALHLSSKYKIMIATKSKINESATLYAQGGIAAVFDEKDSIDSHIKDTLIAGNGLCDHEVVSFIINNARQCINWLVSNGISFDIKSCSKGKINYHLTREGGHSYRRILHNADCTGREIQNNLVNKVLINNNIDVAENIIAMDLITSDNNNVYIPRRVIGAWLWNCNKKQVETCSAKVIVLATGGASRVYRYTTNPDVVSGDGIAMAWRIGCRVANLEFNQFHPTCLFYPKGQSNFLLTEALRGEGALLLRPNKSRFMLDVHERAELAPRDIVSRAIDYEIKHNNIDCVYLDITHKSPKFIHDHFPVIYNKLLKFGFDLTKDIIPVVPAAHYTCGGVIVDKSGRTDINCLYAVGEVSYTGLHGANRMASNSLLECLVYSWSIAKNLFQMLPNINLIDLLPSFKKTHYANHFFSERDIKNDLNSIKKYMWDHVGIVRTTKSLKYAKHEINILKKKINNQYVNTHLSRQMLEIRNLVQVAELIINSAINRKESRGLHFIDDYPDLLPNAFPTILIPSNYIK
ncbi:L-aspartate oxidase [Candidatus Pantoea edessiphila]|uniref:L-aspartate oxidase n=1 Tax=Candidatus Pantoea edessiphila TaxID=2044610 RepID=A0A2P5SWE8_9GAMM|nr:L-aspartate oxidase [Candidatus Pantoea edessiphila]PPI86665.1 L-aspartate oxidase [Candidatus Pantoea edessiphila]